MNRYHIIGFERLSPRSISFRSLTDYEAVHLQPGRALNSIVLSLRSYPPSASILPLAASAMSSTSQVPATMPSSSNFQLIINTALKAYEKKTKRDLLADPLMSQLQTCDSSTSILAWVGIGITCTSQLSSFPNVACIQPHRLVYILIHNSLTIASIKTTTNE